MGRDRLTPANFANLTIQQSQQIIRQLDAHQHWEYEIDLNFDTVSLPAFIILSNVMRPEMMSSSILARYLAHHAELFKEKSVLDMGCGCGLLGVVMGLLGAKAVTFADIAPEAIENTKRNVSRYELSRISTIVRSDLFDNVKDDRYDLIVFNHPFFADSPIEDAPVSVSMLEPGMLLYRFLTQAPSHCDKRIIMPFFHLAGVTNDPGIQGLLTGYHVEVLQRTLSTDGVQKGLISIYELSQNCN